MFLKQKTKALNKITRIYEAMIIIGIILSIMI